MRTQLLSAVIVLIAWSPRARAIAPPPAPPQSSPAISITSVPPYGSAGVLTGSVSGVVFANFRIAVYLQPEGAGWWGSKPSYGATVPIAPNGTFAVLLGTTGLDAYATLYAAVLLPTGVTPTNASGTDSVPPGMLGNPVAYATRYGKTFEFAGRLWAVKFAPLPAGPGDNLFSDDPSDVWVDDQGRLHLTIHQAPSGAWLSTEVILVQPLGHGNYWFTTESELEDLDPNATFGAFTWDGRGDDFSIPLGPSAQHRELDFEASRWTVAAALLNAQFVVQPFNIPGNLSKFSVPDLAGTPTLTTFMDWQPDAVAFGSALGRQHPCILPPASVVHEFLFQHDPGQQHDVPSEGQASFRFNLWLNNVDVTGSGTPQPANGQAQEVIVSDFRFSPIPQALAYGSHLNPTGSLSVDGDATPGGSVTFAIDNPLGTQAPGALGLLAVSLTPDPAFPAGSVVANWGLDGGPGELLVGPPSNILFGAAPWGGPGQPVTRTVPIPPLPSLAGLVVYVQGGLFDNSGGGIPHGLTEALEICIAP